MSVADGGDTPELSEIFDAAIDGTLAGVRTSLPGEVLAYDAVSNRATVRVQIPEAEVGESGERTTKVITIPDVPVAHLGWGSVRIKIPVRKGAQCKLSFASSCLASWKQDGRLTDPQDDRHHHDADVVCEPWMMVGIEDDDAQIEFTDGGEIRAGGSEPLVTRAEFLAHGHPTAGTGAPSAPISVSPPGSSVTFPGTPRLRG